MTDAELNTADELAELIHLRGLNSVLFALTEVLDAQFICEDNPDPAFENLIDDLSAAFDRFDDAKGKTEF